MLIKRENTKFIQLFFFIGFYCIYSITKAQAPFISFNQINNSNGLSNNIVNCIMQDSKGFIWIGTNDGLNRFDGLKFTIFRNSPADTSTISGNIITDIIEDDNQNLWIATNDGGITKYSYKMPQSKQFKQYKHNPSKANCIPTNVITALLTNNKKIWVATGGSGVLVFDIEKETFLQSKSLSKSTITSLQFGEKNQIWAGRQGGGYCLINSISNNYTINENYNNVYRKLPFMAVNKLQLLKDSMYVASWDKAIYAIDIDSKKYTTYNKNNSNFIEDEIVSITVDSRKNIWLGGKTKGLQYFNTATRKFFNVTYNSNNNGTVADNKINCVFIDKNELVWVGTDKGISVSNPYHNQFEQIFIPTKNNNEEILIYDFYKESNETLWIGTNNGLYSYKQNKFTHYPLHFDGANIQVTKFFKDFSSKQLYIGTNYSLFSINLKNIQLKLLPNTSKDLVMKKLISSRITSIEKVKIDGDDCLLITPFGHYLAWYNLKKQEWVSRTNSALNIVEALQIKDHLIKKIYTTKEKEILFINTKMGIGKWNGSTKKQITYSTNIPDNPLTISNNNISDVYEDENENFWVSTYGGGLNFYNKLNNNYTQIKQSPNLSEGIALDNQKNIWGISNGNLYTYQPTQKTIHFFTIPDLKKTTGLYGNIFKENDTSFFVKGKGYFIAFNPSKIQQRNDVASIVFTDFKVFDQSYSNWLLEKKIELTHKQNVFSVEFSAPQFLTNQFITYYAKLDGHDDYWHNLGTHNVASYNNIPGGTYTLQIKAINTANNTESISYLTLIIKPPYWKTWWFMCLAILIIFSITWLIYKYHIGQILKQHFIRNKIAQDLHDNMGSTLSSISVYSTVAKIYTQQKREHDLNNVLEKIGNTANKMIGDMNDIVWSLQPTNDIVDKIVDRVDSFAKPLCVAKNIQLHINVIENAKNLQLPMGYGKNLFLLLKETINNAVKYANATELTVIIQQKNKILVIQIIDNGIGFDEHTVNKGYGLKNINTRVAEMKGHFQLNTSKNMGTKFYITIPI